VQDVAGNHQLIGLFRKGRLPQSSLFVGPEGVGKKTTALLIAAQVNCKGLVGNDLCGNCGSCLKARSGNHPDILLFQTDQLTISIEEMRRLSREAQYRPFEGKLRFLVIDQAEKMSEEAANSILKTLEEPPETTRIVLVTAFPQRLLPTIRSRCQAFTFQRLKRDEIVSYLRENTQLSDVELRASFAEGSLGTAINLDIGETLTKRNLMLDFLDSWLKSPRFESVFRQCESSPLSGHLKKRDQVRHYLGLLQTLCYDVYFLLIGAEERLVNKDRMDALLGISRTVSLEQIRDLLYHIAEAQRDVDRYVNPLICFETLWLGLAGDGKGRC
jgi:DNA polymerase-3 subunit delta'